MVSFQRGCSHHEAAAFFVFEAERSGRFDRKNRGETHGILKTGRHRIVSHISLFL